MPIGDARVSTHDHNVDLLREVRTQAGCEKIFEDRIRRSMAAGHVSLPRVVRTANALDTRTIRTMLG